MRKRGEDGMGCIKNLDLPKSCDFGGPRSASRDGLGASDKYGDSVAVIGFDGKLRQ